jgi:nucleoside diphosphate kinase
MLPKNQPFIFIKPHAINNEYANLYIEQIFKQYQIQTIESGIIQGSEIRRDGLIDKHYAVNAHAGTIKDPSKLFLPTEAIEKFLKTFNISWHEALDKSMVISGQCFQDKMKLGSEELYDQWGENGFTKISSGVYVSFFKEQNCFVLNGFYTSNRDMFTEDNASIKWSIIEFNPEVLIWEKFRTDIIGKTDAAKAVSSSIRGFLNINKEKANLRITYKENIIHASASPFEALIEKNIWLGNNFKPMTDPLYRLLSKDCIDMEQIKELYNINPVIDSHGETDTLTDFLEDKDTLEVANFIKSL